MFADININVLSPTQTHLALSGPSRAEKKNARRED